jgi:hypothetical protein
MKKIKFITLFFGFSFFVAIRLFIYYFIPIQGLNLSSPFITDIIGKAWTIPYWTIVLSDIFNLLLLWLIGEKFFDKKIGFLLPFIYSISPWPAYLTINGSIFVFVVFGVLIFYHGLILMKEREDFWGVGLSLLGIGIMVYSSFTMLLVIPFFLWGFYKSGLFIKWKKIFYSVTVLFLVPIVLLSILHRNSFKMVAIKEVSLFNEVGLINSVNTFRGEVSGAGYPYLGVLVENKITYLGRHVLFNALTALAPYTYFTPQFKLLDFSFTPPIFLGILIPFLYGLIRIFELKTKNYYLLLFTLPLLIPTIIRAYFPNLNSLILILPVIIFISAWGMSELVRHKKWLFVTVVAVLIFLQGLTTLYDIKTREPVRYQKTIQNND